MKLKLTKQVFEFIARVIFLLPNKSLTKDDVARAFGSALYHTNTRFDVGKFLNACNTGSHIRSSIREDV